MEPYSPDLLWVVICSFVIAFFLAFGIGANDVANSFGTSVGSKVLTIKMACVLATIFEIAGSVLIGYKVSDTMRKGILDLVLYENSEMELVLGCLSCLAASAIWLLLATFLKLPVSGTHSLVGGTIGFSIICRGTAGIKWKAVGFIVSSWFISPLMSGLFSISLFIFVRHFILESGAPFANGLKFLPFFYGVTLFINIFSILHDGSKLLHFDKIPLWGNITISTTFGLVTSILVQILIVPRQKKKILNPWQQGIPMTSRDAEDISSMPLKPVKNDEDSFHKITSIEENVSHKNNNNSNSMAVGDSSQNIIILNTCEDTHEVLPTLAQKSPVLEPTNKSAANYEPIPSNASVLATKEVVPRPEDDKTSAYETEVEEDNAEDVNRIFSFLQILTATFGSFAHGGNDVSNAVGPLIAVWLIYNEGSVMQKSEAPIFVLLYGGCGIAIGLWIWGRRVIKTIGEDLTKITPSIGFTIEIGAALTVLLASKIGIPISTTHCKVGSVVLVGMTNSSLSGVNWKLFRDIIFAWVVTLPLVAVISGSIMYVLRISFLN